MSLGERNRYMKGPFFAWMACPQYVLHYDARNPRASRGVTSGKLIPDWSDLLLEGAYLILNIALRWATARA